MNPIEAWISGWNQITNFFGLGNSSGNIFLDIINGLLSGVLAIIEQFFNLIGLQFSIPLDIFDGLNDLTRGIGYILPLNKFLPLVVFSLAFYIGRIIMSVYNRVAHTSIRKITTIN